MIGKIQRVKLREVWKHEAADFTTWLMNNIDVLSNALDLPLNNVEHEQDAGDFSVDLTAEDDAGNLVVVENQLEKSNHDHFGKVLTYLTALDAKTAIWIVAEPRSEHVKAIAWLNESSSAAFYLVKVEAIKIGDSPPALLLTLITGPSEEAIKVGGTKKELAERHIIRKRFWSELLQRAKEKTKLHAGISPSHYNWVGTSAGIPGLVLTYAIRRHDARVELFIDCDKDSGSGNTDIFNRLYKKKDEIEQEFGGPLDWQSLEGRRSCRIRKIISAGGWQDDHKWPVVFDDMIDAMIRLNRALKPHLKSIIRK